MNKLEIVTAEELLELKKIDFERDRVQFIVGLNWCLKGKYCAHREGKELRKYLGDNFKSDLEQIGYEVIIYYNGMVEIKLKETLSE